MDTNPGNSKTFAAQNGRQGNEVNQGPGKVDPLLALELRLRWLEVLIVGMKQEMGKDKKGKAKEEYAGVNAAAAAASLKHGETLTRIAETVQTKLGKVVEGNEGLTRFMDTCMCGSSLTCHLRCFLHLLVLILDDQNSHLLTPSFALSGILPDPPTYDNMSPEEVDAFLAEMEPDIRAADRDMLEIDALEKKGITGAGKLPGTTYIIL
jgi:hypothetical protein